MKQALLLLLLLFAIVVPQRANAVAIQVDSLVHVRCHGQQTGAIYITVVSDTSYSVIWINVPPSHIMGINAIDLAAGTYEVHANAFDGTQAILFITVEEPPPLQIEVLEQFPPDCRGHDGRITVQAVGGVPLPSWPGYIYDWGDGNNVTGQIVPFPGADYLLTVTDANGCMITKELSAFPEYPFFRLDSTWLRLINCSKRTLWIEEDDGVRPESEHAKSGPLSYHWEASAGGNILSNPDSLAILVDAGGRYSITVTDEANGCSMEALAIVTVDTLPPSVDAGPDKYLPCATSTDTLFGIVEGPPGANLNGYWDGPHIIEFLADTGVVIGGPGAYIMTGVNTANGCRSTDTTLVLSLNMSPAISTEGGVIGCGSDTTTITAIFDSLHTRFEGWFAADTLFSTELTLVLTEEIIFLLEVTDTITGCKSSTYAYVYVDTFPPYLEFYKDSLFCDTPSVQIRINEDYYAPEDSLFFVFAWSGPLGFSSAEPEPWVQVAGTYVLTLNYLPSGCTNTFFVEVLSDDDMPPVLVLQNATIYLDSSGMVALQPIQVDNGSSDGCGSIVEWSLEPEVFDCSQLGENTVSVIATDQNGNSATGSTTVFVLDTISPSLACPENILRGSCDAQVFFDVPLGFDNCLTTGNLVAEQFGGLPAGAQFPIGATEQKFLVRDGAGNTATCSFIVTVLPPVDVVGFSLEIPSCAGSCDGQVSPVISGGTAPFQYLWNTGATDSLLSNACAGNYAVTIADNMGCTSTWNTILTEPPVLTLIVDSVTNDLDHQGVGAIAVTAGGGSPPYLFEWLFNGVPFSNTEDLDSLLAGTYSCQLRDTNNCLVAVTDIVVNNLVATKEAWQQQALQVFPNPTSGWTQILLPAGLTGQALIRVFDGTGQVLVAVPIPVYERVWSLDMTNLSAGLYWVQVVFNGDWATVPLLKL